jgi:serine/threonine-protein kinase haspin
MSKSVVRKYGKSVKKSRAEQLFAELPRSPVKRNVTTAVCKVEEPEVENKSPESAVDDIAERLLSITLDEKNIEKDISPQHALPSSTKEAPATPKPATPSKPQPQNESNDDNPPDLRILTWDDVCPFGDRIEKIAEASYAEIYRITNDRGVSIIKVIRLASPIKAQTATQRRAGLVDEEPHSEDDLRGELSISEWLADIPGFVVYKERYIVRGKAPKVLLETHQAFHRRAKRKDPDRLQFYPSPSRYLDDTEFLVVELGDAGTALEDFDLQETAQLWDIFLHTAIALARAEDLVRFEVRRCAVS